ncbi:MAG: terpene cyclase/mutase family protein [Planctomycetes bacterium]|nr:terpene cyclase/mutase family protein [Planctomycetota bacterium]
MRGRFAAAAALLALFLSCAVVAPVRADPKDPPPPPKKEDPPPKKEDPPPPKEVPPVPPRPERIPEQPVEYPKDEPVGEDPTEDPRIVDDATDVNEDPTDKPNRDLAEPPKDDGNSESPHPNRNSTTSAVGLGGGGGGGGRGGKGGFESRRARGGGGVKLDRVKAALEWLKDHQNVEGYWSSTTFSADTKRVNARKTYHIEFLEPGKPGADSGWTDKAVDIGLTGLSLLAFAGAGYDHKQGDYKETCRIAAAYLRKAQGNDGCFGEKESDHFVYNHAICTAALCEIYGLTGDAGLKGICDKAVAFILYAQNPGLGWRYGVKPGVNDTSVTGWMISALKSAKMAGLDAEYERSFADASKWLDAVTAQYQGFPKTGYNEAAGNNARLRASQDYDNNPSMDAINIYSRLVMGQVGWDAKHRDLKAQASACLETLPAWEHHKIDYYYWYYASLALYQMGDTYWKKWDTAISKVLMDNQRGFRAEDKGSTKDTLDEHGSWDAVDAWGVAGGRVYSTAINCLTLEVHYRYLRLGEKPKEVAPLPPIDAPKETPKETPKDDPWAPR